MKQKLIFGLVLKHEVKLKKLFTMIIYLPILLAVPINGYDYGAVDYQSLYINVKNIDDISSKRQDLQDWVWKSGTRNVSPNVTAINVSDMTNFGSLAEENVSSVKKLYYIDGSYTYTLYWIKSINPTNRLMIEAPGHNGGSDSSQGNHDLIEQALGEGYDILIKFMVGRGANTGESNHDTIGTTETGSYNPMEAFLNDLYWSLNYIENETTYTDITMAGISGGGWTSVIYAALDDRISSSYSIAGSYPRYIYDEVMPTDGDWEQGSVGESTHDFYTQNTSYLDMYLIAGASGRHYDIYTQDDIFPGEHSSHYSNYIKDQVGILGGEYGTLITEDYAHIISNESISYILNKNSNTPTIDYKRVISISINASDNSQDTILNSKGYIEETINSTIYFHNLSFGGTN